MAEKLSDRLWDILNEATVRNALSATQLCAIDDARILAKRVEDAPAGEILDCDLERLRPTWSVMDDRASVTLEIGGKRVRLLVEVSDGRG